MTREKAEAAVDYVYHWAMKLLCSDSNEIEGDETEEDEFSLHPGHVVLRSMVVSGALSPAPDPWRPHPDARPDASYKWLTCNPNELPLFEGLDGEPAQYDEAKGAKLWERTVEGDADADAALCLIASEYLRFKREMPDSLRMYIAAILRQRYRTAPRRGRGGDKYANFARNLFILGAVERLKKRGFKPTRNRESKNDAP